jgi:hypothetical protein
MVIKRVGSNVKEKTIKGTILKFFRPNTKSRGEREEEKKNDR